MTKEVQKRTNREMTPLYLKTDAEVFDAAYTQGIKTGYAKEAQRILGSFREEFSIPELRQEAEVKAAKVSKKIAAQTAVLMTQYEATLAKVTPDSRTAIEQYAAQELKKREASRNGKWASLFRSGVLSSADFDLTTGKLREDVIAEKFGDNEQLAEILKGRTLSSKKLKEYQNAATTAEPVPAAPEEVIIKIPRRSERRVAPIAEIHKPRWAGATLLAAVVLGITIQASQILNREDANADVQGNTNASALVSNGGSQDGLAHALITGANATSVEHTAANTTHAKNTSRQDLVTRVLSSLKNR